MLHRCNLIPPHKLISNIILTMKYLWYSIRELTRSIFLNFYISSFQLLINLIFFFKFKSHPLWHYSQFFLTIERIFFHDIWLNSELPWLRWNICTSIQNHYYEEGLILSNFNPPKSPTFPSLWAFQSLLSHVFLTLKNPIEMKKEHGTTVQSNQN
jgi:hypothetical protein